MQIFLEDENLCPVMNGIYIVIFKHVLRILSSMLRVISHDKMLPRNFLRGTFSVIFSYPYLIDRIDLLPIEFAQILSAGQVG